MLIVAGGWGSTSKNILDSTEVIIRRLGTFYILWYHMASTLLKVMDYDTWGIWRKAGRLPGAGFSLQGASIGSDFYVTGGDNVDIRRKKMS